MKKYVISIIFLIISLAWMGLIYSFSAKDGVDSSKQSDTVTNVVIDVTVPDYDTKPIDVQTQIKSQISLVVRKSAHFFLYFCLSFYLLMSIYFIIPHKEIVYVLPAGICFIYAILDEYHQAFSKRGASMKDVLLDTCASITFIVLFVIIKAIIMKIRNKKLSL